MKTGVFFFGLPGRGDEVGENCDKLRKIFSGPKAINSLFKDPDQHHRPYRFYLYTKTWYDGATSCEGTCVYLFNEDVDLDSMTDSFSSKTFQIKGNNYTIYGEKTQVCEECLVPLKDESSVDNPFMKERSPLDSMFCKCCKPDWSCTCCGGVAYQRQADREDSKRIEEYLLRQKYIVCRDCSGDREKQEHWRNHGPGSSVKETSFTVPENHLCDEAIKKIQQKMGGKPPEPHANSTPFNVTLALEDIIDPKNSHYWPYGMSSLEYLQHIEQLKFDNPIGESFGYLGTGPEYDDEWEDIQVTEETLQEYSQKIESIHEKYPSIDDYPGEIPFEGEKLRLIPRVVHGFTCDNPTCQAVFQHLECEGTLQHTFTTIPMYTSRKGDLEGEIDGLSYGYERCLACVG